jgi:hypothetical protein
MESNRLADILNGLMEDTPQLLAGLGIISALLYKVIRILRSDKRGDNLSDDQEAFRKLLLTQIIDLRKENDELHGEKAELVEKNGMHENRLRTYRLNSEVFRRVLIAESVDTRLVQMFDRIVGSEVTTSRSIMQQINHDVRARQVPVDHNQQPARVIHGTLVNDDMPSIANPPPKSRRTPSNSRSVARRNTATVPTTRPDTSRGELPPSPTPPPPTRSHPRPVVPPDPFRDTDRFDNRGDPLTRLRDDDPPARRNTRDQSYRQQSDSSIRQADPYTEDDQYVEDDQVDHDQIEDDQIDPDEYDDTDYDPNTNAGDNQIDDTNANTNIDRSTHR